jgi:hypothetical protein
MICIPIGKPVGVQSIGAAAARLMRGWVGGPIQSYKRS